MVNIHAYKYQTLLLYLSSMYWELHTLTRFYLHNNMYFEALHFFSLLPHGTCHFLKKTCNIQMSFIKVEGWLNIGTLTSSLMLNYSLRSIIDLLSAQRNKDLAISQFRVEIYLFLIFCHLLLIRNIKFICITCFFSSRKFSN